MLRRKLTVYAGALSLGILAGFIGLEEMKPLAGIALLLACGIFLVYVESDSLEGSSRDRKIVLFILLTGSVLFTVKYIYFNSGPAVPSVNRICGVVIGIQVKPDCIKYTIKSDKPLDAKILVSCYTEEAENLGIGDRASFGGRFRKPARQENPHCFDYRLYLLSGGIRYCFTADRVKYEGPDGNPIMRFRRTTYSARLRYEESFDDETRSFIRGVLFGDKGGMDEELVSQFNDNSTGHILAVSGLHIGFIFAMLKRLTRKRKTLPVSVCMIAVVFVYGEMTLWSASTIRAVLVMSINILAMFVRKRFDMLSAVSAAAIVILIANPYQLMNTGFQMSFAAMLGISMISPFLAKWVGDEMGMMLAVQVAVAPYSIYVFHRFNPLSILINIPIVFLTSLLVPVCIVSLMMCSMTGWYPHVVRELTYGMSEILIKVNAMLTFGGANTTDVRSPGLLIMLVFYGACFVISSEWMRVRLLRKQYRKVVSVFAYVLIICLIISNAFNNLDSAEVIFVSVGQGDCTHVRTGSRNVLIDGGGSREYDVGNKLLKPYLLANGVSEIDAAMVTHLHMDHFKGIQELAEVYPVKQLVIPQMCNDEIGSGEGISLINIDGRIGISGDVYIEPIWPLYKERPAGVTSENELNMIYIIHYKGMKIMITGDVTGEDELRMTEYYKGTDTLSCDILKISHHGSSSSSAEEFLDAVNPSYAVISVGEGNMYGHPSKECLKRLEERNIEIYRTDRNGAVGVDIKRNGHYKVMPMHNELT